MNCNPAPTPDNGANLRPDDGASRTDNGVRRAPVADGQVPTAGEVDGIDWSGSALDALVGRMIATAHEVDRSVALLMGDLLRVVESGATEHVLGAAVEVVLAQSCRAVRFERRTLLRAVHVLGRMPGLAQAFRHGWVSWSQVRCVVTAVGDLRVAELAEVDEYVAGLAVASADREADGLVQAVDVFVGELLAARDAAEADTDRTFELNRVVTQPALDGSGQLWGEWDADHFPLLAQALDGHAADRWPLEAVPDDPGMLVNDLAHDDDGQLVSDAALTDAHRAAGRMAGRNATRRGLSLFELATGCDATTLAPLESPAGAGGHARSGGKRPTSRPSVLVTCPLDTLLGGTTPGWVLSTLAGRMKATAPTIRRWTQAQGADARLVVFDNVGQVVGVGRRQRLATGWLRDAVIARDLHDTAPCSTTPALLCDVDHVTPWDDGGRTDMDNLTLVSRRWHTAKTSGRWHLARHADGSRTWTQTATGYQIRHGRPSHLDSFLQATRQPGRDPP